jgi:hypothetical protein
MCNKLMYGTDMYIILCFSLTKYADLYSYVTEHIKKYVKLKAQTTPLVVGKKIAAGLLCGIFCALTPSTPVYKCSNTIVKSLL